MSKERAQTFNIPMAEKYITAGLVCNRCGYILKLGDFVRGVKQGGLCRFICPKCMKESIIGVIK